QRREAEGVVEFPGREQPSVGGDGRTLEFQLHSAVEADPQPVPSVSPVASSIRHSLDGPETRALSSGFARVSPLAVVIWEIRVQTRPPVAPPSARARAGRASPPAARPGGGARSAAWHRVASGS